MISLQSGIQITVLFAVQESLVVKLKVKVLSDKAGLREKPGEEVEKLDCHKRIYPAESRMGKKRLQAFLERLDVGEAVWECLFEEQI